MQSQCSICCLDFTAVLRRKIECPGGCGIAACTACVKTYLLERPLQPCCMNCRLVWTPEFIDETFSHSFRCGPLAERARDALLSREKAMLPGAVDEARFVRNKKILSERYSSLYQSISDAEDEYLHDGILPPEAESRLRSLRAELNAVVHEMIENRRPSRTAPRREFVRPCAGEGCRGFLSTQWNCQLCGRKTCKKCHCLLSEGGSPHACRPEDVATAEVIAKDSKPCPTCGTLISKVDGCDQMWCPGCSTAFSWKTLLVDKGPIHNPEYFRWMRDNGLTIPRNPCQEDDGEMPWWHQVAHLFDPGDRVHEAVRFVFHVRYDVLPRLRNQLADPDDFFQRRRVRYLLNEIDEKEWRIQIYKRERSCEKIRSKIQLYEVLAEAGADIMRRCAQSRDGVQARAEMGSLEKFFDEACERMEKRFGHVLVPKLEWKLSP